MKSRNLQGFLLLMILTRGQILGALLLVVAILAGFALQATLFAAITLPFVFVSSLLILVAVTAFRRAPLTASASIVVAIVALIAVGLQHGLIGFLLDAWLHPPIDALKFMAGGLFFTVASALNYRRYDSEGRGLRAHIAYFGTVFIFWAALFCTVLALLHWREHLHDAARHATHATVTTSHASHK